MFSSSFFIFLFIICNPSDLYLFCLIRWLKAGALPGANRLMGHLYKHKIPFALASNAIRKNVEVKISHQKGCCSKLIHWMCSCLLETYYFVFFFHVLYPFSCILKLSSGNAIHYYDDIKIVRNNMKFMKKLFLHVFRNNMSLLLCFCRVERAFFCNHW